MRKVLCVVLMMAVVILLGNFAYAHCSPYHDGPAYTLGVLYAAEHGGAELDDDELKGSGGDKHKDSFGAEHGDKEHGGKEHGEEEHDGKEHGGEAAEKEHGGKEHGEKEHGGEDAKTEAFKNVTAENIRQTMKNYVLDESKETGVFTVFDEETGQKRRLALVRVHERVGKTGDYYYSCADFKDVDSGELLDLDLDVEFKNKGLFVADVRIHKVEGKERYTYDENDNRIPLAE